MDGSNTDNSVQRERAKRRNKLVKNDNKKAMKERKGLSETTQEMIEEKITQSHQMTDNDQITAARSAPVNLQVKSSVMAHRFSYDQFTSKLEEVNYVLKEYYIQKFPNIFGECYGVITHNIVAHPTNVNISYRVVIIRITDGQDEFYNWALIKDRPEFLPGKYFKSKPPILAKNTMDNESNVQHNLNVISFYDDNIPISDSNDTISYEGGPLTAVFQVTVINNWKKLLIPRIFNENMFNNYSVYSKTLWLNNGHQFPTLVLTHNKGVLAKIIQNIDAGNVIYFKECPFVKDKDVVRKIFKRFYVEHIDENGRLDPTDVLFPQIVNVKDENDFEIIGERYQRYLNVSDAVKLETNHLHNATEFKEIIQNYCYGNSLHELELSLVEYPDYLESRSDALTKLAQMEVVNNLLTYIRNNLGAYRIFRVEAYDRGIKEIISNIIEHKGDIQDVSCPDSKDEILERIALALKGRNEYHWQCASSKDNYLRMIRTLKSYRKIESMYNSKYLLARTCTALVVHDYFMAILTKEERDNLFQDGDQRRLFTDFLENMITPTQVLQEKSKKFLSNGRGKSTSAILEYFLRTLLTLGLGALSSGLVKAQKEWESQTPENIRQGIKKYEEVLKVLISRLSKLILENKKKGTETTAGL